MKTPFLALWSRRLLLAVFALAFCGCGPQDAVSRLPSSASSPLAITKPPGQKTPPASDQLAQAPPPKTPPKTYSKLFEGWAQPQAVLLLTGRQHGYIEPCGCTGLANQKGGLFCLRGFIVSAQIE